MELRNSRRRRIARALLRLAPLTITGFMQLSWFGNLTLAADPHANARRDWYQFYKTGHQLLAGDLTAIYRMAEGSRYFWLYPPYCIYLTAPLGALPEWYAYALCVLVEVAAVGGAFAALRAAVPARGEDHTNAAIVVLASMPFNTAIVIGQISGVLSLILALSLWTWRRGRHFTSGLLLALLFIKPTLAVFFPLLCLLARQWRVLAGIAVGGTLLLVGSLPLGLERWHEYSVTSQRYLDMLHSAVPMWKQLTVYAFWSSVSGVPPSLAPRVVVPWLASVAPLAALTMTAWWRRSDVEAALPRLFGLAVLLAISSSVYSYFPDGLLLLVPGIVWHVQRGAYRSRWRHRAIGTCILLLFVGGYLNIFVLQRGISWGGPLIAVWLVCEALDLLGRPVPSAAAREPV